MPLGYLWPLSECVIGPRDQSWGPVWGRFANSSVADDRLGGRWLPLDRS